VEREKNLRTAINSGRGNAVTGRTLYPVVTPRLTSPAPGSGPDTSWVDTNPEGWDALISVWWEHPPGGEPR
jgi:hypothetical protein